MKTAIKWLKDIRSTKETHAGMGCYRIKDGEIRAANGYMVASHPWKGDGNAAVSGEAFNKVLARVPEDDDFKLSFTAKSAVIKSGSFSANIPLHDPKDWKFPEPEDKTWKNMPPGLLLALEKVRPFINTNSDKLWSRCVYLSGGFAYATNNIVGVRSPLDDVSLARVQMLLPYWVVDFVLKHEGVTTWQISERSVAFRWDNGAWVWASLVDEQYPNIAKMLKDREPSKIVTTNTKVTAEYRAAVRRMAGLIDTGISLHKDRMTGMYGETSIEEKMGSTVPPESTTKKFSLWDPDELVKVLAVSDEWGPEMYPNPCPFVGDRVFGLIAGRNS